jgi:hypothetical protein
LTHFVSNIVGVLYVENIPAMLLLILSSPLWIDGLLFVLSGMPALVISGLFLIRMALL